MSKNVVDKAAKKGLGKTREPDVSSIINPAAAAGGVWNTTPNEMVRKVYKKKSTVSGYSSEQTVFQANILRDTIEYNHSEHLIIRPLDV